VILSYYEIKIEVNSELGFQQDLGFQHDLGFWKSIVN
jgi:hypothetical protein